MIPRLHTTALTVLASASNSPRDMPAANRKLSAMASRMCRTRNVHLRALEGIDCLREDLLPEFGEDRPPQDEIDLANAEELFEILSRPDEVHEANGALEFDQQVDVAFRPRLAAHHRAEQRQRGNEVPLAQRRRIGP